MPVQKKAGNLLNSPCMLPRLYLYISDQFYLAITNILHGTAGRIRFRWLGKHLYQGGYICWLCKVFCTDVCKQEAYQRLACLCWTVQCSKNWVSRLWTKYLLKEPSVSPKYEKTLKNFPNSTQKWQHNSLESSKLTQTYCLTDLLYSRTFIIQLSWQNCQELHHQQQP